MDQPLQILSYNRVKSSSTFTISVQHGDGTTVPLYEVLASNLEPNLTVSRLQSVYPPPQQLPPPFPTPNNYAYAPPAQPTPYPYPYQQPQHQYQPTYPPCQYQPQPPLQTQPLRYHPHQMPTSPQQIRTPIGTITLSSMSSKITFSVHNQTNLKLKRPDLFSNSHQFTHPHYGMLSWKESDLHEKKYKLLDSNKNVLARFDKYKPADQKTKSSFWGTSSKSGKGWAFSIFVNAEPEFLDWIMVTGLGVVEYRVTSDRAWGEALVEAAGAGA